MDSNNNHQAHFDDAAQTRGDVKPDPITEFLEHQRKALEQSGKALESLLPPGFKEHSSEARKEFIKGWKVLVDAAIVELEKASKEVDKAMKRTRQDAPPPSDDNRPSTTGKTKVKVQVD